jgi:hypothetical protein
VKKFTLLKFVQDGVSPTRARNQDVATVDFRVSAQSEDSKLLNMRSHKGFFRVSMVNFLMLCPLLQRLWTETYTQAFI